MANGIDQNLLQQGLLGGQGVQAPALTGLFAGQQQALESGQDPERNLLKKVFPGLFKPSKREQGLLDIQQEAQTAQLGRARSAVEAQAREAGIQLPRGADTKRGQVFESAARGEAQGLQAFETLKRQGPAGRAARRTGAASAQQDLLTKTLANRASLEDAAGGRFGTNLTFEQFSGIRDAVSGTAQGTSTLNNIADVIENTTPQQLLLAGSGPGGGTLQGQLEAQMFSLFRPLQNLLEDKASVLRQSDREAIEDVVGNPAGFMANVFSRDPKTVARLKELGQILARNTESKLTGLDDKTRNLLAPVLAQQPSPFTIPEPGNVRDPASPAGGSGLFPGAAEDPLESGALQEAGGAVLDFLSSGRR